MDIAKTKDVYETVWQNGEPASSPTKRAEEYFGEPVTCLHNDLKTGIVTYASEREKLIERINRPPIGELKEPGK